MEQNNINNNKNQKSLDDNKNIRLNILIDDIRFSKQQMLNTVYLTILAIAAILSLSSKICSAKWVFWVFWVFALLATCIGIKLVVLHNKSARYYRDEKNEIINNDSKKENKECKDELLCKVPIFKYKIKIVKSINNTDENKYESEVMNSRFFCIYICAIVITFALASVVFIYRVCN
ncbi:MAG: hypothetical protein SVV67_10545 [Bacillota bacterium]|nr:hypothetical protein [Bacillota bacterium]